MTIIPKVGEWLEKQGYSLEMRAASAFRAAGFVVRQSSYYLDSETNKPREMDVEAMSTSPLGYVDVRFFVECKSGDKPWVLLCSVDTLTNYNRLFAFGAMSKLSLNAFGNLERVKERIEKFSWLKKDGVIAGYSFRQAFSKDVDSAYTAAMNVTKACHYHVIDHYDPTDIRPDIKYLYFAFPVIVVDTPIIRCTLDAHGEMELLEVDSGEFLFGGHELGACIRIVTVAHLSAFAVEAKRVATQLQEELRDEEDQLVDSMKHLRG